MSITVTLLTILSGICLLLWGLRTIKRAILRGYGAQVQKGITLGTKNRFLAFISGIIVTMFLQSSTAAALLASSFVGRGLMTVTAGLAVMIGADVGASIIAQILSFDMRWLAPFLLSAGIIFHLMYDDGNQKRFLARIIMGLGFILMGLGVIREATSPLSESVTLPLLLSPLEAEPILAILIAAVITYMMHSGLSAILLFSALAASNVLSLELALTFVVGANVGVAIIPMVAVMRDIPEAVQIPLGNIIMRMVVGIIALLSIPYIIDVLSHTTWGVSQKIIFSHIGYNLVLAAIFLPFVGTLAKICKKISPAINKNSGEEALKPKYLDKKLLSTPPAALSCATRETLHMSEVLESMLVNVCKLFEKTDDEIVKDIEKSDEHLDTLYSGTKDYIISLTREELSDNEANQSMRIMNFAINLEHCGDIIEKSLLVMAKKKAKRGTEFSKEGLKEIQSIHKKVVKNLKLAQSIFLSSDEDLAKQLIDYKKGMKIAENNSSANHIKRLQQRLPQTMATTGMHMDVVRDLRQINTYISSVAYGVLDNDK